MSQHILAALGSALLLAACDERGGSEVANTDVNMEASDSAEQTRPESAAAPKLISYPGSSATSSGFSTGDTIDRVIAWYRDPTRREEMMYASTERLDDGHLVMGTAGEEGRPFALKLTARSDGGTDGRLIPYDPKIGLNRDLLK